MVEKEPVKAVTPAVPVRAQEGSQDQATDLLREAAGLLKPLRSVKSIKLKQVVVEDGDHAGGWALLDGGATHALRRARLEELGTMEPGSNYQGPERPQEGQGGSKRLERVANGEEGGAKDEAAQASTSPYSTYAGRGGCALLRCWVEKAACEKWGIASLDVATSAFGDEAAKDPGGCWAIYC